MEISYQDFAKLEIRIGLIEVVEPVEGADRLLKLQVDFGEFKRQIVSGIREYFPEYEVLVGRSCPFLVNLETRVIRGEESQGMILAAGENDIFSLLHPDNKLPPGTLVQ
jgi:methionyl-tRNA synthetase